jgi:sugar phosphate permease
MWDKKSEQFIRIGFWKLGVGTGTIVGALASYSIQHYSGTTFKSWQIMFLVFRLIMIVVGICVVFFLPDNPIASRLSQAERLHAIERVSNKTGT